jgi:hypothetical protein
MEISKPSDIKTAQSKDGVNDICIPLTSSGQQMAEILKSITTS